MSCVLRFAFCDILAQVKLEDVFKSTHENIGRAPDSARVIGVILGVIAIIVLLIVLHYRITRASAPKPVNHHGKLLKELQKSLPIKNAELKQLTDLATQQGCSSPVVLMLCPSLLAKTMNGRSSPSPSGRGPG